jgi:hypothetical protein
MSSSTWLPGDVRRDLEDHTGVAVLDGGAGPAAGRRRRHRAGIDDADRRLLTDLDRGEAVVHRAERRLGLDVAQADRLQRLDERDQAVAAEHERRHDLEGGAATR